MDRARVRLLGVLAALLFLSVRDVVVEAQDCTNVTAPSQPQDVGAMEVSFSCVDVLWMPPSDAGGGMAVITQYNITYNGTVGTSTIVDGNSTTYQVTGLTPATTYSFTVSAENNCSMTSQGATATATTEVVPVVTSVMAQVDSNSTISVNWTYGTPMCGSVDGFVLTYSRGSGAQTMVNVSNVTRSFDITGLNGMQGMYNITMTAVYQSVPSDASTAVVDFNAPPPPGDVSVVATSGSSINVTWTPPSPTDNRPPVTGYTVTAAPSSGSSPVQLPATDTSTVLNGLQNGTEYTIQVVATNLVGNSLPRNSTVNISIPPPPGGVMAMATSGSSITVTWTPPPPTDNRPPVTGYTVTAAPSSGSSPVQSTSSTTSIVLSGLQEDTTYTIQVVARNVVGDSLPETVSRKTFGRPGEPQKLRILLLSSSSITVEWVEPADDGGDAAITYTITLQGGPNATRTGSSLSTTFTGLEAPNTYTVTVTAVNRAGSSLSIEGGIHFRVPAKPDITDLTASSTALTVTWTNSDTNIELDGYTVTVVDGNQFVKMHNVSSSSATLSLVVDQRSVIYTVTVTAVNKVGPSMPASRMIFFAVPGRPREVAVTLVSGSELSVSWTAPDQCTSNVPPVMYYTVSWRGEGGEDSHNINGANNTMYQITGLAQGTRYTVNVTAHNSVGESEAATGSGTTLSVPHAVSAPDCAGLLPAVVALSVALFAVLLLLAAAVIAAILFYTRNRKLTAILKDAKGSHSQYEEVKMGPYSEAVIENPHSSFKFKAEAQYEECEVGVTGNDVSMEENPAYAPVDLLH